MLNQRKRGSQRQQSLLTEPQILLSNLIVINHCIFPIIFKKNFTEPSSDTAGLCAKFQKPFDNCLLINRQKRFWEIWVWDEFQRGGITIAPWAVDIADLILSLITVSWVLLSGFMDSCLEWSPTPVHRHSGNAHLEQKSADWHKPALFQ